MLRRASILLLLLCFAACRYEVFTPPATVVVTTPLPKDSCGVRDLRFGRDVLPIFRSNCASNSCHGGSSSAKGINLEDHDNITAYFRYDTARLLGVIRHEPNVQAMPLGGAKLDSCKIARIETWVRKGMLAD
jgi:hypothetical protein